MRHHLRMFTKHPGFTITAILTLALGIGANTSTFSILNLALLRPVSGVTEPGRLVFLRRTVEGRTTGLGHLKFREYQDQAESFSGMVAERDATVHWHAGGPPTPLRATLVTGGYFSVLGVRIGQGRGFLPEETRVPGTHAVAVLSHRSWTNRFGADPGILGRQIRLNDTQFTVVGVAPREFQGIQGLDPPDFWLPLMMEEVIRPRFPALNSDFFQILRVIGRLKPGVAHERARGELAAIAAGIETPEGTSNQRPGMTLDRVVQRSPKDVIGFFLMYEGEMAPLFGAAILVLAIVCANLAGLLIARHLAQRKVIALQLALGAPRGRLVSGMVGEAVILAGLGALLGLPLARWSTNWVLAQFGFHMGVGFDLRVGVFVALLSMLVGIAFGLTPALQATRRNLVQDLKEHGTIPARSRLRRLLVSGQIALSLALIAGAALFARTMQAINTQDVGFETDHLYLFSCDLAKEGYSDPDAQAFFTNLTDRVEALPGVIAVSRASEPPLDRTLGDRWRVLPEGAPAPDSAGVRAEFSRVTPGYFNTLGMRLMLGRDFTSADGAGAPQVAMVNEALAKQLWPDTDPIGRSLRYLTAMGTSEPREVVGMVQDVRNFSGKAKALPEVFLPLDQNFSRDEYLVFRLAEGAGSIAPLVQDEVHGIDAEMPPVLVESVAQRRVRMHSEERFQARVTSILALLALLLSGVGLFGVLSFQVSHQLRDTGVRMALGAEPGQIFREVLRDGFSLALPGVGAGLLGALVLARLLRGLLFGVESWDPLSFGIAATLLVSLSLLVSLLPAVRATKVDPATSLRYE